MANGYTRTECYYTARQNSDLHQICLKRAILRTDILSHQMSSPLPPKSSQSPILGNLAMQNLGPIIQRALHK